MPPRKLEVTPEAPAVLVIRDPYKDANREYPVRVQTRKAKREINEARLLYQAIWEDYPNDGTSTEDQDDELLAAACELLDKRLVITGDGDSPGTMLLKAWREDLVVDERIFDYLLRLDKAEEGDPT